MKIEVKSNGRVSESSEAVDSKDENILAQDNLQAVVNSGSNDSNATAASSKREVKRSKTRAKPNNKATIFKLDIDAGAKRVKCRLNGQYKSFPSEAKEVKGDVPLRNDGCFQFDKRSYVVGRAIDRVNGRLLVASQNNKISSLEVWIVGALTHYRKQLKQCVDSRRRKNEPARIELHLRIVTLSSPRRKELDKVLKQISVFVWEDVEFSVAVKSCEFIDEGEGAALEVAHLYKHEIFNLIDLGGGTCTYTTYYWDGEDLGTEAKTPVSGAGTIAIINRIFKALTRVDRGAIQAEVADIQEALKLSRINENDIWSVPLRSNGKLEDISNEVEGALSEWVHGNYALLKQFDFISQSLAKGEPVYCSGGGFAIKVVADWIIKYLSGGVENANIKVLDNPQHINLAGLKWLDAVEGDAL